MMAVLCVDIGGSKIAAGIFEDGELVSKFHVVTPKGKENLAKRIGEVVARVEQKLEPVLVAATPGRYVRGRLAPGSAQNLGEYPGEFDGVRMSALLGKYLPGWKVVAFNDALAQMAGGVAHFPQHWGQKMAYLGPGTGLGAAFGKVSRDGRVRFYTDGHIYDMDVGGVGAEDILSGRALKHVSGHEAREIGKSFTLFYQFFPELKRMGQCLAQIVEKIYSGDSRKMKKENDWSASDIEKVKGTRIVLLGGSLGAHGHIAACLHATARQELAKKGLNILLLPIPHHEEAALKGAFMLAYQP
jgi:predicted NBD/HSP70 family sugar kinase